MPDLSVSETQLERLEEIREDLEAVYVGDYGILRRADALQYLLDTYVPPDADGETDDGSPADITALTAIDGVGEATEESLADAGFASVGAVVDADPETLAEIDGVGQKQALDIATSAATLEAETEAADGDDSDISEPGVPESDGDPETPEDTLKQAMSLLDAHGERWRTSSDEEPYEVDLPDGSTTGVRTKDDVKRLLFKHWQ